MNLHALIRLPGFATALSLLFALVTLSSRAVEITSGPNLQLSPTQAILSWTTDTEAGARVHFGPSPRNLSRRVEGPVGTRHQVTLDDLTPGTQYHYSIGTARRTLLTRSFTTPTASTTSPNSVAETPLKLSPPKLSPPTGAPTAVIQKSSPAPTPKDTPPPTRKIWGNLATLQDHFDRHGRDFDSKDPDDYARQAWEFLQRARREGLPAKRDSEGVLRVFDPKTRAFAAYNRDFTIKTYFKPSRRGYFDDQPGTPIDLRSDKSR